MTNARWLTGLALLGLLSACGDADAPNPDPDIRIEPVSCEDVVYPSAPEGLLDIVHVSACAVGLREPGDGSRGRPFAKIQDAIDAVPEGGAVLVAAGEYAENLKIGKGVAVIGSEMEMPAEQAGIILQAPNPNAISVNGAMGVLLRGFNVKSPVGVGLLVEGGGEATLEGSWIEGASPDSAGQAGHGIVATSDAAIILQRDHIWSCEGGGVLIDGAKGQIIHTTVSESKGTGGIRIARATGEVRVEASQVLSNANVGIAVLSSRAIILQSEVMNTIGDGKWGSADGILLAELVEGGASLGVAEATLEGNTIEGNDRAGIVVSGNTKGIILQNQIRQNADHTARGAGIWLQAGAGTEMPIQITKNTISGNHFFGIGVSSSRAIILQNNAISETALGEWADGGAAIPLGEGIGVFKGAFVQIEGNTINKNAQRGIFLDMPDLTSVIKDNVFAANGNKAIILQSNTIVEFTQNDFSQNPGGGFEPVVIFSESANVPQENLSLAK
jgi:parallel beta-helix repeat protein